MKGNEVPPGTAIASFKNGVFDPTSCHAAILIIQDNMRLYVLYQYNHPPKNWGERPLPFTHNMNDYANNGELFYIITR